MSQIKITAFYDAEAEEIDENDSTGLTEEAHTQLMDALMDAGLYEVTIQKV